MTETNPFPPFIPPHPAFLVIGSFPCFNGNDYGHWFYSGSGRNHFWPLLSTIFRAPATTLAEKKKLCSDNGIALTDVGLEVQRRLGTCADANLKIVTFNRKGIEKCLSAGSGKILFTGSFAAAQFRRHFGHGLDITILPSPSPAANRFIAGIPEYRSLVKKGTISSPYEFRLLKYQEAFSQ